MVPNNISRAFLLGCCLLGTVLSQSTDELTDCHFHGDVEYCVGPDGTESAVSTRVPSSSAAIATQIPPQTTASNSTSATAIPEVTALDDCHMHGLVQYCMPLPVGEEVVVTTATASDQALPTAYTDCRENGEKSVYCLTPSGEDVLIEGLSASLTSSSSPSSFSSPETQNCHFHAGVEHCTGGAESESQSASASGCGKQTRDYNIPLRIGALFTVLATSSLSVFGPIFLKKLTNTKKNSLAFVVIKQFGTGVIIATAYVHLLTHAQLLFDSPCVGELKYEATVTAIAMGGAFAAFLVDYLGHRFVEARRAKVHAMPNSVEDCVGKTPNQQNQVAPGGGCGSHGIESTDDKLSVAIMEMGIIFHSVLIGITLVVAGDSGFTTLFIVIVFHQMFEGLALGSRITALVSASTATKLAMAAAFAFITPFGMAIGIGVRNKFNGNDKTTLVTLGTLDALSAGILVWVGLVEMWATDWLWGDMKRAGAVKTVVGIASLVTGMIAMGVLGKWA